MRLSRRPPWTFSRAIQYLETFVHYEKFPPAQKNTHTFDLAGFRKLLAALGNPQERLTVIHVAGTKGKGSTCAMIASILRAGGFRVGLTTSPHLVSYRERIQVNGQKISGQRFAAHVAAVRDAIERHCAPGEVRTAFEILTAVAFLEFAHGGPKVDFAVVEAGLGGTLDATNVVTPLVAVLTPVSLDHTALLGGTAAKIAADKSGIIKRGAVVVVGPQLPSARTVIVRRCRKEKVRALFAGKDWRTRNVRTALEGTRWDVASSAGNYDSLFCPLAGRVQAENGATALMAALAAVRQAGVDLPHVAVRKGLGQVRWPGRFQQWRPGVILDGAHNAASARCLAQAFQEIFPARKAMLVLGISKDKDVRGIIKNLSPIAAGMVATQAASERALPAESLAQIAAGQGTYLVRCEPNPMRALRLAKKLAARDQSILVTGSLFLVGDILAAENLLK